MRSALGLAVMSLAAVAPASARPQDAAATRPSDDLRAETRRENRRVLRWALGKAAGETVAPIAPELVLPDAPARSFPREAPASGRPPARPDAREPLVLLVHGLGGDADTWRSMREALAKDAPELAVGEFRYDSRQAIEESGRQLSQALARLKTERKGAPVYLVSHSLGGLVSRVCVETPELDPKNVRQLILLGVPSGGSRLAPLHVALDLAEVAMSRPAKDAVAGELIRRGLADARDDLEPDSQLLRALAARPRNPKIEYHAIIGTGAPLPPLASDLIRWGADYAARKLPEESGLGPKLRGVVTDLSEIEAGFGDGVVSAETARIPGVETTEVKATHTGLPKDPRVQELVAKWLRARRRADLAM